MSNENTVTNTEDNSLNVTRSRRWLLKSSAGLTAAAIAAPMMVSGTAVAETAKETPVAAYDEYEIVGGI